MNRRSAKPITMDELKISEAKSMGTNESKAHDHEVIKRESKIGEANNHG